jgi:lipopolysaccharide export system permease protein
MEKLGYFIDQEVPTKIIVQYYVVFIPEIIRLMLPVSVLLGTLFTVGKLSNLNELTAIQASGISFVRFSIPFLVTTLIISFAAIYFGGYVVPKANKQRISIERNDLKKGLIYSGSNIYFQDKVNRIVTIDYFNTNDNRANRVSIQEFNTKNLTEMIHRIDARKMIFDSTSQSWVAQKGVERFFLGNKDSVNKFEKLLISDLSFKPEDVIKKQRKPDEMPLDELKEYAKNQLATGNDPTRIEIEYHSRIAFAFASFVVVLFGLTISANKRKGGLAVHFGINVLIVFIYLIFMKISQAFGKNGIMHPILTAWIANLVFLTVGIVNFIRLKK